MDGYPFLTIYLAPYEVGQLEIAGANNEYLVRGEIKQVVVDGDTLEVRFAWLAQLSNGAWRPLYETLQSWEVRSLQYQEGDTEQGVLRVRGARRILFHQETLRFFPPGHSDNIKRPEESSKVAV
ncbi:MAG: hypothetical protein Q7S63_02195 [bacterium]|nr:hypothetical protein [bacterium]